MQRRHTIVVGAGVSGLTAARLLALHGQDVVVIEARQRIGGRLHSVREGARITDVGASWVHGIAGPSEKPLYDAVVGFGMPTIEHTMGSFQPGGRPVAYYDPAAKRCTDAATQAFIRDFDTIDAHLYGLIGAREPGTAYAEAIESALDELGWSGSRRERMREYLHHRSEEQEGADARDLEAHSLQEEIVEGDEVVFPRGYDELARGLALGLDVRTEHVVTRIDWSQAGVVVIASDAAGTEHAFTADRVVVTVPIGVLRSNTIAFDPPLPEPVASAIDRLRMNAFEKIVLRFDERFWDENVYGIRRQGPAAERWHSWYDLTPMSGEPTLLTFAAGKTAREIRSWNDEQITASVMASLREIYGAAVAEPVHTTITRWQDDPFARGAYSFLPVGSGFEWREALATVLADGALQFAGEATWAESPETVAGALQSGHRAAERILGQSIAFARLTDDVVRSA